MKTLYFVRHGKATDSSRDTKDFDRYLTEKGERHTRLMGSFLKEKSVLPDYVVTSPAKRTLNTSLILCNEIGFPIDKIDQVYDIYEAYLKDILDVIYQIDNTHNSAMLFGHNPSLVETVSYLGNEYFERFSKGAVACLQFNCDNWKQITQHSGTIAFYETPKNLDK